MSTNFFQRITMGEHRSHTMFQEYFMRLSVFLMISLPCFAQGDESDKTALVMNRAMQILETSCIECHDARGDMEAGLSLTSESGMLEGSDLGPVIDEASPASSVLLEMLSYRDEDHEMPPEEQLPPTDIEALTQWVTLGAPWPEGSDVADDGPPPLMHGLQYGDEALWAFRPVERPPVPQTRESAWAVNPIDAFVLEGLNQAGLKHAPPAEKGELVRRLFYDLTGLAPSTEQSAAFANDSSPRAYEDVVDYLLASEHYGEKWGRHWLDLVHYADSHGYERDANKPYMWRYRDYVIRSFNEDKPYDQFVVEQMAGDELENPDAEDLTATGFYLLGLWDDEPSDKLLARYDNLNDIVDTSAQVFLGLTMGCARCHGHKLDPFPQSDYYRYLSFFEGVDTENRRDRVLRYIGTPFEERVEQQKAQLREERVETAATELSALTIEFRNALVETLPEVAASRNVSMPDLAELQYRLYKGRWNTLPDFSELEPEQEGPMEHGFFGLPPDIPGWDLGFTFEGLLRVPASGAYTFQVDGLDGIQLSIDGEVVFRDEGLGANKSGLSINDFTVELKEGLLPIQLMSYSGGGYRIHLEWSGPDIEKRILAVREGINGYQQTLEKVFNDHGEAVMGPRKAAVFKRLRSIRQQASRPKPESEKKAAVISEKGSEPPETHIHLRGNPQSQGRVVKPGFPEIFQTPDPVLPSPYQNDKSSGRRRVLAEWIASPSNPLTARVMVNRIWQFHFGRGIVRSSNNFGAKGDRPTHPELLDWLAAEFVEGGWSMKQLHKTILMSNTYRMSSRSIPENLAADPTNNLFWRFDMRRLTAEEVRDSLLQAAGNLNTAMFGPGIYPVMPPEAAVTSSTGLRKWGTSSAEEAARRSVYIHAKRSLRLPIMTSFDAPEGDTSCPVRFSTTQPTQALGMLNSAFVNKQAQILASRVINEVGEDSRFRVRRAIEIVVSRAARAKEVEEGLRFMEGMQSETGLSEDKAFERFCLLALNLNEFMYID
jgi:mono/diheme cytochrome c family protein